MRSAQHPSNNHVLGAPQGWDHDEAPCDALAITVAIEDGLPVMHSWWTPTERQRQIIAAGGAVKLTIVGRGHPPVRLDAEIAH